MIIKLKDYQNFGVNFNFLEEKCSILFILLYELLRIRSLIDNVNGKLYFVGNFRKEV